MFPNMKGGVDRTFLSLPRCLCRLITDAFLHLLPLFLWNRLVVQRYQIVLQMLFNVAAAMLSIYSLVWDGTYLL